MSDQTKKSSSQSNEEGQVLIEFILLLAMIVLLALIMLKTSNSNIGKMWTRMIRIIAENEPVSLR